MFTRRAPTRIIRTLVVIGFGYTIVGTATSGRAEKGRCLIQVDGRTFLKGTCSIEVRPGGSFAVGVGEQSRSKHFAYVELDSDSVVAQGYWNGLNSEDHAGEDLGLLKRNGACWTNRRTRVCAWR